jgi:triacylglycerol lipase
MRTLSRGAVRAWACAGFCACSGTTPGVGPATPDATAPLAPDAAPAPASHGPYPIVLVHGLFGFNKIGPLEYFYGVPELYAARGRQVFTPQLDAIQSSEVRGAQLVTDIEAAKLQTGADKVVLIGHSQGGFDVRWAANHDPDSVAAVVTLGTPHRGSPVADVAAGAVPGDAESALDDLADLFGVQSASFSGALSTLTSAGAASFNAATPDVPGIPYMSVAGRSGLAPASACPPSTQLTATWDSSVDAYEPLIAPVAGILAAAALPATPVQDGLVTVDSAEWGEFLGCIPTDHLQEVCQIAGASDGLGNSFDCLQFFGDLESLLSQRGF